MKKYKKVLNEKLFIKFLYTKFFEDKENVNKTLLLKSCTFLHYFPSFCLLQAGLLLNLEGMFL